MVVWGNVYRVLHVMESILVVTLLATTMHPCILYTDFYEIFFINCYHNIMLE